MTSEGLGDMFEGDSADTWARKFPLVLKGGRVEGLVCADPGARTPIGASGICCFVVAIHKYFALKFADLHPAHPKKLTLRTFADKRG
jgi:hypothetical protein